MDKKFFEKGKYYYFEQISSTYKWIALCKEVGDNGYLNIKYCISQSNFHDCKVWGNIGDIINPREATPEEINWLEACVKAGRLIPKPAYTPTIYEIY